MPPRRRAPRARLSLETLECRLAPAAWTTETFEAVATGGLPGGWAQTGTFFVSTARANSLPNELVSNAESSNQGGRAWIKSLQPNDVRVSVSVFLDNLNPIQLVVRGSSLDGNAPSYYGLEITRGLTAQLVKMVAGVSTNLGTGVASAGYASGIWVRLTLQVQGNTLTGQVYRPDKNQYLNSSGGWQSASAWALQVTDLDQPLSGSSNGSLVGLARPARYASSLSLDDFSYGMASMDFEPPVVTLALPSSGALSGIVPVVPAINENVGISRVEFLIDGALTFSAATGPFTWNFDTRSVWDGKHTMTVRAFDAAGNATTASTTITTLNSLPLPRPAIPSHYSHIRIAQLAYNGWPQDAMGNQLPI